MSEWKNVTDTFSEEKRNYNGKYLEIDEALVEYSTKVKI